MPKWVSEQRKEKDALRKEMKVIEDEMGYCIEMMKGQNNQKEWQALMDKYNYLSVRYEQRQERLEELSKNERTPR
jgi:hypothetical protein